MSNIVTKYAEIVVHDWGCTSIFEGGLVVDATPHPWDHHYHVIAHRCGYEDNLHSYTIEHETAHHVVEEVLFDRPSRVLLGLASGKPLSPQESAGEELLAQTLQRYARASEQPIIGGVDWARLRDRFFEVLA